MKASETQRVSNILAENLRMINVLKSLAKGTIDITLTDEGTVYTITLRKPWLEKLMAEITNDFELRLQQNRATLLELGVDPDA